MVTKRYVFPERERHEQRVTTAVDRCVDLMDLSHIRVSNVFSDIAHGEETGECELTAAITDSSWEYRQASITWYLPMIASMSDADLEVCVVHELCHVLLGPIREHLKASGAKLDELATENVARAILKAWRADAP